VDMIHKWLESNIEDVPQKEVVATPSKKNRLSGEWNENMLLSLAALPLDLSYLYFLTSSFTRGVCACLVFVTAYFRENLPFFAVYKPLFCTGCGLHTVAFLNVSHGTRFKPSPLETWIHGQIRQNYLLLRTKIE